MTDPSGGGFALLAAALTAAVLAMATIVMVGAGTLVVAAVVKVARRLR